MAKWTFIKIAANDINQERSVEREISRPRSQGTKDLEDDGSSMNLLVAALDSCLEQPHDSVAHRKI